MEAYIYEKITDDFVMLRYLTCGSTDDKDAVKGILADLERILPYIEKFGTEDEKEVLGYAVRTAAELVRGILPLSFHYEEKHRFFLRNPHAGKIRMVNDFFDAVHNICELFTGDTWEKEEYYDIFIAPFRAKYGRKYFKEVLYYFGHC